MAERCERCGRLVWPGIAAWGNPEPNCTCSDLLESNLARLLRDLLRAVKTRRQSDE